MKNRESWEENQGRKTKKVYFENEQVGDLEFSYFKLGPNHKIKVNLTIYYICNIKNQDT